MNIYDIPTWLVAFTSLTLALVLVATKEDRVSIKILSLSAFMQFIIYTVFTVMSLDMAERQFIARSNNILSSITLIILILANTRRANGH